MSYSCRTFFYADVVLFIDISNTSKNVEFVFMRSFSVKEFNSNFNVHTCPNTRVSKNPLKGLHHGLYNNQGGESCRHIHHNLYRRTTMAFSKFTFHLNSDASTQQEN